MHLRPFTDGGRAPVTPSMTRNRADSQRRGRAAGAATLRRRGAQGCGRRARSAPSTSDSPRLSERSERSERSELCGATARPSTAGQSARRADRRSRSGARCPAAPLRARWRRDCASLRMHRAMLRAYGSRARNRHRMIIRMATRRRACARASRPTATPSSRSSCARPSSRRWAYSDDALERPIVGIANTFSDYNPCHGNVPQLIEAVKRGVMLAGGLPMEFPTISIHESFAYPTSMFLRNLMAMDTEEMIRAQPMDAVVLIGGCDKTMPAQLMAAASADVPAIVVPVGPMLVGHHRGRDARRLHRLPAPVGRVPRRPHRRGGDRGDQRAPRADRRHLHGDGHREHDGLHRRDAGHGAAGRGDAFPATHADRLRSAEASGAQAVAMAERGGPRPSEIMTRARVSQRARRAAGDRRLDQRADPSHRHRRPARHRDRPRRVRPRSAARCRCWST